MLKAANCSFHHEGAQGIVSQNVSSATLERRLADQLRSACSADDIVKTIQAAVETLGFKHFSFACRFVGQGRLGRQIVLSTSPSDFLTWHDDHAAVAFDQISGSLVSRLLPFFSDENGLDEDRKQQAGEPSNKAGVLSLTAQHHTPCATSLCTFIGRASNQGTRETVRAHSMWILAHMHDAVTRIYKEKGHAEHETTPPLTERELQCLTLIAKGLSAKEAGKALGTTERTVAYYVDRARRKLRTKTTMEAFAKALRSGVREGRIVHIPVHQSHRFIEIESKAPTEAACFEGSIRNLRTADDLRRLGEAVQHMTHGYGAEQFALLLQMPSKSGTSQYVVCSKGAHDAFQDWPPDSQWAANGISALSECIQFATSRRVSAVGQKCFSPGGAVSQLVMVGSRINATPGIVMSIARTCHARATELALKEREDEALTQREMSCLRLSAEGNSYSEIAQVIGCSARSVRYHLDSVSFKCNARNIRAAMAHLMDRGLLSAQRFPTRLSSSEVFWHTPVTAG